MADEKVKIKFSSMQEMAERFAFRPEGAPNGPLLDSSDASAWSGCLSAKKRGEWGVAWRANREKFAEPMEARDFVAVLGYETHGEKFESSYGWSSLGMWLSATTQCQPGSNWALASEELFRKLQGLVDSGASMPAFQATYPDALERVLSMGDTGWSAAAALLKGGWNPNAWQPMSLLTGEALGLGSMHRTLKEGSPSIEGCDVAAKWTVLLREAQAAGFDLDSRSMSGETSLGICLKASAFSRREREKVDPRVEALLALGADPLKASMFWISSFHGDPIAQKEMLVFHERQQLASMERGVGVDPATNRGRHAL
jgi:hypothetical protein